MDTQTVNKQSKNKLHKRIINQKEVATVVFFMEKDFCLLNSCKKGQQLMQLLIVKFYNIYKNELKTKE